MKTQLLRTALTIAALTLAGCSGMHSTLSQGPNRPAPLVYPMTAEQADKVVAQAMAGEFAGSPVSRVEFPNKGYQGMMRFALDSHTIAAYSIPAKGRAADGAGVDCFAFEVNHSGTMAISGSARASKVFRRINDNARLIAEPLPLAGFTPHAAESSARTAGSAKDWRTQ